MKKIFALYSFLTFVCTSLLSQDKPINFIIDGSKIKTIIDTTIGYALPIQMIFTKNFEEREILFIKSATDPGFLAKGTFGGASNQIQPFGETSDFRIRLESDRSLSFKMGGSNPKINLNRFFIKIGDQVVGPIKITTGIRKPKPQFVDTYVPGYLFYDAQELRRLMELHNSKGIDKDTAQFIAERTKNILKIYDIADSAELSHNPFLKDLLMYAFKESELNAGKPTSAKSLISSIGGLDVTNIADGLAKFLVKRAKQELSMAFFDKLKKIIEKTPDLKTLFPQTSYLLTAMGDEVYNYDAYVQNLREGFKDDIKNLPDNFPGIIDNHKGPGDFFNNKHQELEAALRTACYVVNALQEQTHPGDILDNYPLEFLDSIPSKIYKGAIQTLQLISVALKDSTNSDTASYWVNIKKVREMVSEKISLKIYLGLIYQKAKVDSIMFKKDFLLTTLLDSAAENFGRDYDAYKRYIQVFATKLSALNKMIKDYDKPATDSLALELYAKYFTATVDMIEYCTSVSDLPHFADSKIGNLHKELKIYFNIAYATADLTMAINRRNYSSAINKAVYIYDEIIAKRSEVVTVENHKTKRMDRKLKKMDELSKETGVELKKDDVDKLNDSLHSNPKKTLVNLVKYGSFMASVATAKSSDDVEAAIEAFALPAGSSKIKRTTIFNVALNGYAGFFYGHESIPGIKDDHTFNSYGITAPVGISVSMGRRQFFNPFSTRGHSSYSLFISLIDVGAIASYRIKNDSIAQIPTVQLKDIFAPGAFLSIGIPKTPLSLNLGAQFGANLRKVKDAQNDYTDKTYTRLSASLCVDIPIVNFYTKSQ